jgi:hypothetical protein
MLFLFVLFIDTACRSFAHCRFVLPRQQFEKNKKWQKRYQAAAFRT